MLTKEEASYLHWLGKGWTARGAVVEIGPWLGGSTYCLAAGMAESGHQLAGGGLITFDDFVWRDFFATRAPAVQLEPGQSFRSFFEANMGRYTEMVAAHTRRLPDETGRKLHFGANADTSHPDIKLIAQDDVRQSVEIAFVDGAKSWSGLVHTLHELGPLFVPGETLTVWQDFKYPVCYWVHMAVAALAYELPGSLELVHDLPFNTVALRLTDAFDHTALTRLPVTLDAVDTAQGIEQIDWSARMLEAAEDVHGALLVRLGGVGLLADKGETAEAVELFSELESRWPVRTPPGPLYEMRRLLEAARGKPLPESATARRLRLYHGAARLARRARSRMTRRR